MPGTDQADRVFVRAITDLRSSHGILSTSINEATSRAGLMWDMAI